MNVFNATLPQEQPEQKINDVCELFSQTLRSLAKDAEAVRQLTSLAKLSGVVVVGAAALTAAAWQQQQQQ